MKTSATLSRQIRAQRRVLRRLKRAQTGAAYSRAWVALKALAELQRYPTRAGLGAAVAMAVRRAI